MFFLYKSLGSPFITMRTPPVPFTFKQFHIDDSGCGMPVSTDAVLLGAWAPLAQAKRIVDIGAGSGLLSLMAAQRNPTAQIDAVELDDGAAIACQRNFAASPWPTRLRLHHQSIQGFCEPTTHQQYDAIVCNPPYFATGPQADSQARANARHTSKLTFGELTRCCHALLSAGGSASFILPTSALSEFTQAAIAAGFAAPLNVPVSSVSGKTAQRQLILLSKLCRPEELAPQLLSTPFDILGKDGQYSDVMRQLTQDFYLKL